MKSRIQKETALKGLLILVLLANVSWQQTQETFNLTEQSSLGNGGETLGGGSRNAPATSAPAPELPPETPTSNPPAPQTDAGSKATGEGRIEHKIVAICGVNVYVTYREINVDGSPYTAINLRAQSGGNFRPIDRRVPGPFAETINSASSKEQIDADSFAAVRNRLGARCAFSAENQARIDTDNSQDVSQEDREKIKERMQKCESDSRGVPLAEERRLQCLLRRLSDIDVNTDRRGGRIRAQAELERILKELRKGIKNRLMSDSQTTISEGEEMIDETVDIIKDKAVDLDLSPMKATKLISSLQSLKDGGATYRLSRELDEDVKKAKEEAREELREIEDNLRANPRDPMAINQANMFRMRLKGTYEQLMEKARLEVNPSYISLLNAERSGLLPMAEFSQFAKPYQMLAFDLNTLSQPQFLMTNGLMANGQGAYNPNSPMGPGYAQPFGNDFSGYRNNLAGGRPAPIGQGLIVPGNPLNQPFNTGMGNGNNFNYNSMVPNSNFGSLYPNGSAPPLRPLANTPGMGQWGPNPNFNGFGTNPGAGAAMMYRGQGPQRRF